MPASGTSETGASTLSRSIVVTVSVFSAPLRLTVSWTGLPIGSRITAWLKSGTSSAKRTLTGRVPDAQQDVAGSEAGLFRRRTFDRPADQGALLHP